MKRLCGLLFVIFLSGCSSSGIPTTISLENTQGLEVGYGFALSPETFITADHIFQSHRPLFFEGRLLEIIERDRAQDMLRFRGPEMNLTKITSASFYKKPLEKGRVLYWAGASGTVLATKESKEFRGQVYKNLIVLSGEIVPGDSGLPVYDKSHRVVGMILGGEKGKVYLTSLLPSIESGSN